MNTPRVLSTRNKITKTTTIRRQINNIIVVDILVNGVLKNQEWKTKEGFKKSHPNTELNYLYFRYYDDISFLDSETPTNYSNFHKEIPTNSIIEDWSKFKGPDHILSISLYGDGNIYKITDSEPIPMWRKYSYLSPVGSDKYDLDKALKVLNKKKWIKNAHIVTAEYYLELNCSEYIEFDYKLPSQKDLRILNKEPMFKEHLFNGTY